MSSTALVRIVFETPHRLEDTIVAQKAHFCPIGPHKKSKNDFRHEFMGQTDTIWTPLETPDEMVEKNSVNRGRLLVSCLHSSNRASQFICGLSNLFKTMSLSF